jgi:hypothetical protein
MGMRGALRASLVLLLLAGCGSSTVTATPGADVHRPGSRVADYFSPPEEFPGPTWSRSGHPVDGREVNSIAGPSHCDWQQAVMMHVGWPLGTVSKDMAHARQYIRDPQGVIDQKYRALLGQASVLPPDAVDTGYRLASLELWTAPSDPDSAYLKVADDIERWPPADPPIACA